MAVLGAKSVILFIQIIQPTRPFRQTTVVGTRQFASFLLVKERVIIARLSGSEHRGTQLPFASRSMFYPNWTRME